MRVEKIITTGWGLRNNVWLLGDDTKVILIDAPHDSKAILEHVGKRKVEAVLFTHSHPDHVNAAKEIKAATQAPLYLHPADRFMWHKFNPDFEPDHELADGQTLDIAGTNLKVLHTPGHTPGGVCFYWADGQKVFTGDTLFPGGPGATKWEFSDFKQIIDSIKTRLLILPSDTEILPGHGKTSTIGAESPHLDEWVKRGY